MSTKWERTEATLLDATARLLDEVGFLGLTVDDLVEASGVSRAQLYEHHRGTTALLVALVDRDLIGRPPITRGDGYWSTLEIVPPLLERLRETAQLERLARGVAAAGSPRLRAAVARLDLIRLQEAVDLVAWASYDGADDRAHLFARLLSCEPYVHLVGRSGWSERDYGQWVAKELNRVRQRRNERWHRERARARPDRPSRWHAA